MKAKVRRGCFETNSSSVHTICISPEDVTPEMLPSVVHIEGGCFGWNYDEFWITDEKASYLLTLIVDIYGLGTEKEREATNKVISMLGAEGIKCDLNYKSLCDSYVDHAYEWEYFLNKVLEDKDLLYKFLFGNSVVITGNDNDDSVSDVRRLANRLEYDDGYEVFV